MRYRIALRLGSSRTPTNPDYSLGVSARARWIRRAVSDRVPLERSTWFQTRKCMTRAAPLPGNRCAGTEVDLYAPARWCFRSSLCVSVRGSGPAHRARTQLYRLGPRLISQRLRDRQHWRPLERGRACRAGAQTWLSTHAVSRRGCSRDSRTF